jgi:hypothetical protein
MEAILPSEKLVEFTDLHIVTTPRVVLLTV